ncbi:tyrosine-type recombinase/integrase [Bifidobacterium pseudocatenulatum]|uniref:tyrosine-type recombinase/integrase n=2 Tax=Bifidobacterium pseudocatenulatum TaxID=28026 RepID=UPI001EDC1D05|nr:tyrosine-type recombinase/integrase [Bifidobacterium pseudocatenulatum]MCG4622413.1 tyrosine-type recombinase/integrase [Bifidobacterium pseudocatenulatum]MCG4623933.1 tyrosine-type recombinase/integrase [Bifidobacterium pseudocatenulatum]MCG4629336.1 tyrosine-type recombinase/integrase [Bifidobacterium pseudocatenulatum]MCG4630991.1 tyrosine-type recombinase/integrase [Bifidobacterium pseudocatenulatum]MCG4643364.1 tyrosine-type recombinase/integrase [Bifidobacterium pseudocatenulatum]
MRNKISAPVPWRKSINGWTDTLRAAGLSAQTIKSRRYKMVHLATLLMPSGPEDVTTEQIVQAFARQQWKPETRKAYRNTISSFFRWLHKSGRRSDDPSLDVPRVKKPHAHPRPCQDRYIAAAMKMATTSERLMIRLGAECGLRRGEIARVHSDDVVADSAGRSLIVRGKGDKQRIVPLPDDLAGIIMDARGYLFPGRFGGHVEESYIGDHISRLLPDGYAAHTLRHRFATTAYAATHDLFVVAELLGHESVETTEHYVAMPDGRLREAMAAVRLI